MNSIRTITLLLALGITSAATAQIRTLVEAVETAPENIILPASANGMMTFRGCSDECDKEYQRVQLTPESRFSVDGRTVKFEDFRREFVAIKRSDKSYALVSYDTTNGTLTSLIVTR